MTAASAPSPAALRELYDAAYAGDYMASHSPLELHTVATVLGELPADRTAVLDYGCGRGTLLPLLGGAFPRAALTGVDISERAIEEAARRFPHVQLAAFDGTAAPLPDARFDLVFSYHVLEHVGDLEATVADIARLTAPGGYVCAILPSGNAGSLEERIVRRTSGGEQPAADGRARFFYEDPSHLRRVSSAELTALFAAHGLALESLSHANRLWGALEWITGAPRAFVDGMVDPRRGRSARARAELLALKVALRLLRSLRVRRRTRGAVGGWLERRALREWARQRSRPDGSAQYLTMRRPLPSG